MFENIAQFFKNLFNKNDSNNDSTVSDKDLSEFNEIDDWAEINLSMKSHI